MINIYKYLDNFFKGTKNPSLKAMKFFMSKYDNFEKNMKFIHIAGTNGKGSCTEIISNILVRQGYKVGKFLSPHLIKYNERISINGTMISDRELSDLIEELQPIIDEYNQKEDMKITLFELETIMGLLYFYRSKVDFVVLETGLGGLFDCTNIISKPLVSVISSIGYDHMHILGNTLEEIAIQKAGIIKKNSHTVIFDQIPEVNNVFIDECNKKNNTLHIIKNSNILNYSFDENFQYFDYKDIKNISLNLKGKVQIKNASLCIEVVKIIDKLGYTVSTESIKAGLKTIVHKGRMETLSKDPLIIFDGAHNVPAIEVFQDMVNMYYKNMKRIYVISILKTKDYKKMLKILSEDKDATFILTGGIDKERYVPSKDLAEHMKKSVNLRHIKLNTIEEAVLSAINTKNSNTVTFFIGSFYTYGTVIDTINKNV